jgi:hypothetical protein
MDFGDGLQMERQCSLREKRIKVQVQVSGLSIT